MEGNVEIFEGLMGIGTWSKNYMILNNNIISLCKRRGEKIQKKIHLSISTIYGIEKSKREFKLDNGYSLIKLRVESNIIKKKWLEKFQYSRSSHMNRHRSMNAIKSLQNLNTDEDLLNNIGVLLENDKLKALEKDIAKLYEAQATFKNLFSKVIKNNENKKKEFYPLLKLANDIKKLAYRSLTILKEQFNELSVMRNLFKNKCEDPVFLKQLERNAFKYALEDLIDEKDKNKTLFDEEEDISINMESLSNDTIYYSMIVPDQIEKSFLINKDLKKKRSINENFTNKIKDDRLRKITDLEVFKKYPILEDQPKIRRKLPAYRDNSLHINAWAVIKENIGKDFTKISMPVYFNEPISALQKSCELIEYREILRKANKTEDRYLRIGLVFQTFFLIYSNVVGRVKKPFNPLKGETYEFVEDDFRMVIEQTSHHPPIHCFHAECDDFIFEGTFDVKIIINLKGASLRPTGLKYVHLKRTKETFKVESPSSALHNIIIGEKYIWNIDKMTVINQTNGDSLVCNFIPKGWSSKNDYKVHGKIFNPEKKEIFKIEGKWNSHITLINNETSEEFTEYKHKRIPNYEKMYFFCNNAMNLNNLTKEMFLKLPPTDCRLRPDLRSYEYGDIKLAGAEKDRLEKSQRARRKTHKENGYVWKPVWFDFEMEGRKITKWKFKGEYWKYRKTGNWPKDLLNLYV